MEPAKAEQGQEDAPSRAKREAQDTLTSRETGGHGLGSARIAGGGRGCHFLCHLAPEQVEPQKEWRPPGNTCAAHQRQEDFWCAPLRCCCLPSGLLLRMSAGRTEAPSVVGMCAGLPSSRLPWREGRGSPEIWAQSHRPSVASRNSVTCALNLLWQVRKSMWAGCQHHQPGGISPHLVKDQLDCV